DRFKAINDTLGHGIGDLVLIEIANRLRTCIPPSAKLARLGGDEFTILTGHFQDIQIPKMIAQEILTAIQKPLQVEGHTLRVTPSIGIAIYPDAGEDLHSLLKHADMAMYTIKNNGKNNFSIYNEKMSQNMRRKLRLEQDLFNAIENKEIFLQYQPQIDIAANQVIGVEALVRWNHPQYGIISPCEFIPIAEETGLIAAIGEWVLREACSQMKAWKIGGFPELKVAVNLSAAQFKKESFVQTITTILRETGLDPCSLDLELTERIAMNNEAKTMQKLKALKELGIHISIDDFGTGYSSLAYLPLYPIDSLKIAREFINMAENCTEGKAIISTILSLAKTLNISVIAEGVETAEQLQFLKSYGCHRVQGYLFSKPLDKDACLRFLEEFSSISC
ncbi:MAG: putative bifunctional diguanylate cyclase/phosphodiesterase, partial [Ectobacillus sp.]